MLDNHAHIQSKLDYFISSKKIPNIIFHGSSGSGKRTIADNFLYKIYDGNREKMKKQIMTVECSHGKGIKFIREDLKFFAKSHIQSNQGAIMGKLKNAIIAENEQAFKRIFEKSKYSNPRTDGITEPSEEQYAQWDIEFNAWLDDYEKSFGDYL